MRSALLGATVLFILLGCGHNDEDDINPLLQSILDGNFIPATAEISSFNSESPYAGVLKGCVNAEQLSDSCSLSTLPLIGQDSAAPETKDIMDRVVVSHAWMGVRFQQVLGQLPADIKTLMKAVTAIVIDDDIRPSYYNPLTGAIYLDPAYLWLTNEEKATISTQVDFRADFGNGLQFESNWRYVKDNDYAYEYFSLHGNETRFLADIFYPTAKVLYHELAHANDFFPTDSIDSLAKEQTLYQALESLEQNWVSIGLDNFEPLTSVTLMSLAQVLYRGEPATSAQKSYSPEVVGLEFENDGANDDYAYSNIHEDVAILFEEAMMKYHFGLDRDIAFTSVPSSPTWGCEDFVVGWGVRNRIGDPLVRVRAQFVVENLLPDENFENFFADLPTPIPMTSGLDWCENLTLGQKPASVQSLSPEDFDRRIHLDSKPGRDF